MRIIIAGLLGGIAMFLWSSIAHVATPLGTMGVSTLSTATSDLLAITDAATGHRDGLYIFGNPASKSAAGQSGFLVFNTNGPTAMTPANLILEFATELTESILVAWLLAQTALVGFGARVGFVAVVGAVASIATNIPYWNWYKFPADFTLAAMIVTFVGYFVAGIAIAAVLRPRTTA